MNMFDPFKNYKPDPTNQPTQTTQELMDEFDSLFGTSNQATQTNEQELEDDISKLFGSSDRPLRKITPTPQEHLQQLAAGNHLDEFKKQQAKLIEDKDPDYDIQEALEWAVNAHAFAVVQEIVEIQGVVPGTGPCGIAMDNGSDFYVEYLFAHGADAKADDEYLVFRAAVHNPCYLPFLAERGAKNYTPILSQFIDSESVEAAIYMLENGAVPDMETLKQAAKIEDLTILKYLLTDKGMVPSKEFIQEMPPLFIEAKHLLTKAYQKHSFQKKMPPKANSQSRGMKI